MFDVLAECTAGTCLLTISTHSVEAFKNKLLKHVTLIFINFLNYHFDFLTNPGGGLDLHNWLRICYPSYFMLEHLLANPHGLLGDMMSVLPLLLYSLRGAAWTIYF